MPRDNLPKDLCWPGRRKTSGINLFSQIILSGGLVMRNPKKKTTKTPETKGGGTAYLGAGQRGIKKAPYRVQKAAGGLNRKRKAGNGPRLRRQEKPHRAPPGGGGGNMNS